MERRESSLHFETKECRGTDQKRSIKFTESVVSGYKEFQTRFLVDSYSVSITNNFHV